MKSFRRHALAAVGLVGIFAGALCLANSDGNASAGVAPGNVVDIVGVRVTDIRGNTHRLGILDGKAKPVALVFLDTACPVATRYIPILNELYSGSKEVSFYGVLSNPNITWREGAEFADSYGIEFPLIFDSAGDLYLRLRPVVTSESFVVSAGNRVVYRGRINDQFAAVGKLRNRISSHDLRDVMTDIDRGREPIPRETPAVGCFHHTWGTADELNIVSNEVTYVRHIAPLLEANCVECHREEGIAPFSLEGYENARRWHRMVTYMTAERLMPPWRAMPSFGEFRDARRLSDHQIELLRLWSQSGAPLGDPADVKPAPTRKRTKWRLGEPDLVLRMEEPFEVPGSGEDIYRYFVIPTGFTEDKVVVGLEFSPGDPKVVHHSNYLLDFEGRARAEDEKDDTPGFSVFGTGGFLDYNAWGIGGWTPGAEPYVLGENQGMWIPKGSDLVVEIHYHLNGKATTDQSEVAFYFAKRPVSEYVDGVVIGTQDLDIPPGEENYWRHFSMQVPSGISLTDVTPHMHFLGREFISVATLPDASKEPLVWIADWDFRWQNTFTYREPVYLPAGSRIDVWIRYDNSTNNSQNPAETPKTVRWGWETTDEMSELWLGFIPDSFDDRDAIVRASERSWYQSARVSDQEIARVRQWLAHKEELAND